MRIGAWQFRARLAPTLVTLLLLPILIALGLWQTNRADYKQAQQDLRERNQELASADLRPGIDFRDWLGRRVIVTGELDRAHAILLANRKYQGRPGYYLMAPVRLSSAENEKSVLVNLGWVAQEDKDQALAAVAKRPYWQGVVDNVPSVGLAVGEPDAGQVQWPRVLTYLDADWFVGHTGHDLAPVSVLVTDEAPTPLVRDWRMEEVGRQKMPAAKHRSYALQWFSLAAALLIIYIVVNLRRVNNDTSKSNP